MGEIVAAVPAPRRGIFVARCGTRAGYVAGCRCPTCRAANRDRYRDRAAKMRELAAEVRPSGPPGAGTQNRAGKTYRIALCPGANGAPCVRGGGWLRVGEVCGACIERATVWDGRVPVARARVHLNTLSAQGVGYKAVAAACDVSPSVLARILADKGTIRASTERRILAVDGGARADHSIVDGARVREILSALRDRGFTYSHVARELGQRISQVSMQARRERACAMTVQAYERLWRRIERGELVPERFLVDARAERAFLNELLDRGVPATWLSARLGFHVGRSRRVRMYPATAARVRAFRAEIAELRREGAGMPDGWESAGTSGITRAFGFEAGWSWGGASPGGRAPKKSRPTQAPRPATMTPEERRERARLKQRERRAAMDPETLRARNREHQRAKRARDRAKAGAAA